MGARVGKVVTIGAIIEAQWRLHTIHTWYGWSIQAIDGQLLIKGARIPPGTDDVDELVIEGANGNPLRMAGMGAGMPINVLDSRMQSRYMNSKHQCTRHSSCGELRGLDNDNDMQWERRQYYMEIRSVRFNTWDILWWQT